MHSTRSDVEPIDASLVPLFISEIDTSKYTLVAMLTLLVYDAITTIDKEIILEKQADQFIQQIVIESLSWNAWAHFWYCRQMKHYALALIGLGLWLLQTFF
ncbi:hypothetical protein DFH11DRAFT_1550763 [Phellopilus nigrolimitatus]|nr:hypothetical protein DFH11DRAFT_1550763 [Phellopilus nigrolimitatus]